MPEGLTPHQLVFLVILLVSLGLLVTERLRNDVVALLMILALGGTGILSPGDALSGFSSEPALIVAGIFVLSGALHRTGLSEHLGQLIGKIAGTSYSRVLAVIMLGVALLSAFTHHLTTTAIMLPVTQKLAAERDIPPSKLLMPLSFAASLGTTITIIGAPAFLIASTILERDGRSPLGVFSIAPIGLALTLGGAAFVLLIGRFLLPARKGDAGPDQMFRLDDYFTEVKVLPESTWIDRSPADALADDGAPSTLMGWLREGRRIAEPYAEHRIQAGDVLLLETTPEGLLSYREAAGVELHAVHQYVNSAEISTEDDHADHFVQAVVAPNGEIVGRSLAQVDFRRRFGAVVVSLWRGAQLLEDELSRIQLRAGDILVLMGEADALARVAADRSFILVAPFHGSSRPEGKAPLSGAIMLATVLLAATGLMELALAVIAGAVCMVLTRCITPKQAYESIDVRIFVFIAGAIPLGVAMERTGVAQLLSGALQPLVAGWNPTFTLLAIFAAVAVVTQVMSDAATTALFGPVALTLAHELGHAPEAYVVTVAMASVVAFLTPIGHHGNLLIYGPGGYRFADFARVGAPLTAICALLVALIAPWVWPL